MSGTDRILFFGTPEFAVPTLAALCDALDCQPGDLLSCRPATRER